jgi:hypothetical protein
MPNFKYIWLDLSPARKWPADAAFEQIPGDFTHHPPSGTAFAIRKCDGIKSNKHKVGGRRQIDCEIID